MIRSYYAVPEKYTTSIAEEEERQETEGLKDIIPMPEYKIEIPSQKLVKCLNIINQKKGGEIKKRELKDLAIESGLIHLDENRVTGRKRTKDEYTDQAAYMSLDKSLIEPLQKYWKFITETKIGTHHIHNTEYSARKPSNLFSNQT